MLCPTKLRFDVSGLAGKFSAINSLTIRLTQNLSFVRDPGTLEAYGLLSANADWNSNATWGTKDGTYAWAGGAMVPSGYLGDNRCTFYSGGNSSD
jgi:hypothetical protein